MNIVYVWGIFPTFILETDRRFSSTIGPVIRLSKTASEQTYFHEVWHVKQFYALILPLLAISFVLLLFSGFLSYMMMVVSIMIWAGWQALPFGKFVRETAAYGESLRRTPDNRRTPELISRYAEAAVTEDGENIGYSVERARKRILSKFASGELF